MCFLLCYICDVAFESQIRVKHRSDKGDDYRGDACYIFIIVVLWD